MKTIIGKLTTDNLGISNSACTHTVDYADSGLFVYRISNIKIGIVGTTNVIHWYNADGSLDLCTEYIDVIGEIDIDSNLLKLIEE